MLEAIAALLVVSVGAVGVLWWQQQAVLRQQQQNYQFIAISLASDLADRMRINASQKAPYALGWGESRQATQDCVASACSWTQLAQWDIAQWQQALRAQLPRGDASVYPLSGRSGWWADEVWDGQRTTAGAQQCDVPLTHAMLGIMGTATKMNPFISTLVFDTERGASKTSASKGYSLSELLVGLGFTASWWP
jgi:type IV pilus assembly protein PilV